MLDAGVDCGCGCERCGGGARRGGGGSSAESVGVIAVASAAGLEWGSVGGS